MKDAKKCERCREVAHELFSVKSPEGCGDVCSDCRRDLEDACERFWRERYYAYPEYDLNQKHRGE